MDSILNTTKALSGIGRDHEFFDEQVISYINSVFFVLRQVGVGPDEGFVIADDGAEWTDFIPNDAVLREATKAYVSAKVRMQFDPPTSSSHVDVLRRIIEEYEWRLNVDVETEGPATV